MNQIVSPPGVKLVQSFKPLGLDSEVGMFEGSVKNYCVVVREGLRLKGVMCISMEHATEVFETCVGRIKSRQIIN